MKVPLLDLNAHHAPIRAKLVAAFEKALDSGHFILGPAVEEFEKRIADYCGVPHAIGVSSGSDALLIALMGLGIGPGDEVITSDYSFFASAGCISRLGATPVFVDIDPATYNIDPELIEAAITPRTKAIIPVHLFGQCADMDPIMAIAQKHGLPVIEDAAQAIGAEYRDGRRAGSIGMMGCFSFFPSKNLGAFGDAGMVVTTDQGMADKLRLLRMHGAKPKYHHQVIGGNFRIDAIQAAILNVKFDLLDQWTRERQQSADHYDELFEQFSLLNDSDVVRPDAIYADNGPRHYHIYNQYVIRVREREQLQRHLAGAGIGSEVYYPVPFHKQKCFASLGYAAGDFPHSNLAAEESLAIPVSPGISPEQRIHVATSIKQFVQQARQAALVKN